MKFEYDGRNYSFHLDYFAETYTRQVQVPHGHALLERVVTHRYLTRGGGPGESVVLTLTEVRQQVRCTLYRWDPVRVFLYRKDPSVVHETHWENLMGHISGASPKDRYSREIGRELAIGRFMHHNPFVHFVPVLGRDEKHLREPETRKLRWDLVSGDPVKGAEFYRAMQLAWRNRARQARHAQDLAKLDTQITRQQALLDRLMAARAKLVEANGEIAKRAG